MKHIKEWNEYNINNELSSGGDKEFYFSTNNYEYKLIITKHDTRPYYYVGFRAKKENEPFYDMGVITNDDYIGVMKTIIKSILKHYKELMDFYEKYNVLKMKDKLFKGYIFSFQGDKRKSEQRLILYKRYLPSDWSIRYNKYDNKYYLEKI